MATICAIVGAVNNAAGVPAAGACIQVTAQTPQNIQGGQKSDQPAVTQADVNGGFSIDLVRGAQVRFTITDTITGTVILDMIRTVPDAPTQELDTWA